MEYIIKGEKISGCKCLPSQNARLKLNYTYVYKITNNFILLIRTNTFSTSFSILYLYLAPVYLVKKKADSLYEGLGSLGLGNKTS